jgi:UDP-glucose 4-epimerase
MFADSYYIPEMSKYDFDYQLVSFEESLKGIDISEKNRRMK